MGKFNIKVIKNSKPLKYFENCIEHYCYEYNRIIYMRIVNSYIYGIHVIKNSNE
jgi:hypothetical protein